jgi:hypothetical protein
MASNNNNNSQYDKAYCRNISGLIAGCILWAMLATALIIFVYWILFLYPYP